MLLYYDPLEIDSVKEQQQYDVFQDLLDQRRDAVFSFVNTTKINIMEHAPKETEFNKNLTREVNGKDLDVAGAVSFLGKYLSDRGIPGITPTPSPTPSPTPTVVP